MASEILASATEKVKDTMSGQSSKKTTDLQKNTKDVHDKNWRITSDYGVKQANTDEWLTVTSEDKTGPMLLEDNFGREKIHRFDHERIPERVVHARGSGAFGKFTLFESAADVTSAGVLTDTSRETPVFVRFSTVLGSRGSADTVRDVRGFAVKFYTEEGNWDIVGNNIPVFFIQDSMKFPDVIHAGKPEPNNEIPQAQSAHNNFWDFQFLHSETTHMFFWTMSDRAIPRSYRMMQGFGVNTFTLTNDKGERNFVKFIFTPELGVHSFVWDEALKIAGQNPDFHRHDLWTAIENGAYPKWKFGIQTIPESQEHDFDFDILDATKVWPEELVPIRYIGELELNRNPDEFFTQTEQVAFCTSHIVPGIGFSDDPLLQGRNFSYQDTQLSRLGTNWEELPINKPVCPVMNHNRDGAMRHTITKGTVNYWPNRFEAAPPATAQEGAYIEYPQKVAGIKARTKSPKFREHINQAELFYNSLSAPEQAHLTAALGFELDHCDDPVVYKRICERLSEVDLTLAQSVAEMVGSDVPQASKRQKHNKKAKGLSQLEYAPATPTIATRRIAILIADGFDSVAYYGIKAALTAAGALPFTIAPRRNTIYPVGESKGSGKGVVPDHHLEGMRSTLFDSVFVPGGAQSIQTLRKNGRATHWIREAFGHLKAIGASGEAVQFVRDACDLPGMEFSTSGEVVESYGVVTVGQVNAEGFKEKVEMAKGATNFVAAYTYAISMHKNFDRETDGLSTMVAY
ncbi:catalase-domain-containing protein [Melanomma pulvis-pyrius CBS 109.77]|uniref:Catalase n=1 Tax=Melanomma pulvis-pyrius CBS 109.77 TaxID=1314802 RepID=A0A6A6WUH4_9PLEO|nr:catalase-domain-containing protein [Melanomma pulvis-pyrius CBS 109.77]